METTNDHKAAVLLLSAVFVISAHGGPWAFNGSNQITRDGWTIKVSISSSESHELATAAWESAVVDGSGDLDLTGGVVDGSNQSWSLVSIGAGGFSSPYQGTDAVKSLVLPDTIRTIGSWAMDQNGSITNLVIDCPRLTSIGSNALRLKNLRHFALCAPLLTKIDSETMLNSEVCETEISSFNLDSLKELMSPLPKRFTDSGVIRLPSLEKVTRPGLFSDATGLRGLILGGAREDGSMLSEINTGGEGNLIKGCRDLEFVVIGHGDGMTISGWSPFDTDGCDKLRRIFFAGCQPSYGGGGTFFRRMDGALSICFYIPSGDQTWDDVVKNANALTEGEITRFRELFGEDEPLPFGTLNYKDSGLQYFSYGDYRSFVNDVIVRDENAAGSLPERMPMRLQGDGPTALAPVTYAVTEAQTTSADGRTRSGYYGYTLETFGPSGWTGGGTTNYGQSVTLSYAGSAARRIVWLHGETAYKVVFTDRGFLEEYPETFSVSYPDGAPDGDGFLSRGKRVTLSVAGFATEGDHPGAFVAWEGEGAEALSGQGPVATFSVQGPMVVHPRTTHAWTYVPKHDGVIYNVISDGNWKLAVSADAEAGELNLLGKDGDGWSTSYLSGSGNLDIAATATDSSSRAWKIGPKIGNACFQGCDTIRGVRLTDNIQTIGQNAFRNCSKMIALEFEPNGLVKIGETAFKGCSVLSALSLVQTNLTTLGNSVFSDCGSLTQLHLEIPCVTSIGTAFAGLPLAGDLSTWNLASLASLDSYGGFGREAGGQSIAGVLHLPSVTQISSISLPRTVTGIDFGGAIPTSVSVNWCSWSPSSGKDLRSLWFRRGAPAQTVLDNLMSGCTAVDGEKNMTVYCSKYQPGWADYVTSELTANEQLAAEAVRARLQPREKLLGVYVTASGDRKAWIVHQRSPYDNRGMMLILR